MEGLYSQLGVVTARNMFDLTRRSGRLAISKAGIIKVFKEQQWKQWAQQLVAAERAQQSEQQRAAAAAVGSPAPSSIPALSTECRQQVQIACWAADMRLRSYPAVFVGGVRFATARQRRHAEQGWAALRMQPDSDSMWFVQVLSAVQQPHYSGVGQTRELLMCHMFESRPAVGQGPKLDALGLIVIPNTPTAVGGCTVCAVAPEQLVPMRLCVVPNMRRVDSYVVLIRQPLEILLRAAGFDAQTRVWRHWL